VLKMHTYIQVLGPIPTMSLETLEFSQQRIQTRLLIYIQAALAPKPLIAIKIINKTR